MTNQINRYAVIALLIMGSAILLFSCEEAKVAAFSHDEMLMTEYSDSLEVIKSESGKTAYHFTTPLMEGYSLAKEPYREFRKGVKITTYKNDSMSTVDVVMTSNYAIYYEELELWEAKGNVVVTKADSSVLYTQQLFWNARTNKIYSNVDSKIVQKKSKDTFIVEGFESDEKFELPNFRRIKSVMRVTVKPTEDSDSTNIVDRPNPPTLKTEKESTPVKDERIKLVGSRVSRPQSINGGKKIELIKSSELTKK